VTVVFSSAFFGGDLYGHLTHDLTQVRWTETVRIAQPQERVVQDIEHEPRFVAKRPLRAIERHVILGPWEEAASLAARLGLTGLQSDRWVIVFVKVACRDHPADQAAQSRQQVASLDGVRAFISSLMTLRVSTANGFSPFSGSRLSISPVRCSRVDSDATREPWPSSVKDDPSWRRYASCVQ
jgi:hypothetical protein